ncbi:protein prune homolog 2 isoform X2 [Cololabis saira]|uniref:protein prune homolog 2 isoform X2 n=1 Tax=Cololabis saira TaxID=129043 RepID=UPI002AD52EF6|nr:protein prune homolog 2 isoform X2 [Cololabis saira]
MASEVKMNSEEGDRCPVPPTSLSLEGGSTRKKKLSAPKISLSLDQSEDDLSETPDYLNKTIDDLDTPEEGDGLYNTDNELEGEAFASCRGTSDSLDKTASYNSEEKRQDGELWRTVVIGEQEHRINMKIIEPYMKVVSHGGYYDGTNAIIVFAACFLPDSGKLWQAEYLEIMDNLFLYVVSTLELMVAENYIIVYLSGATPHTRMPSFSWLKKCYLMIDRRLKKNLKSFIILHPSWLIRTIIAITKPFISTKFSSKIKYVKSLDCLEQLIPMDFVKIPDCIIEVDQELTAAAETPYLLQQLTNPMGASTPKNPEDDAGSSGL